MKTKSKNRLLCIMMVFMLTLGNISMAMPVMTNAAPVKKFLSQAKKSLLR